MTYGWRRVPLVSSNLLMCRSTKPHSKIGPRLKESILVLVVLSACAALPARAQTGSNAPPGTYTFVFSGIPVGEALGRLIEATDISLIYESGVVQGKVTYCRAVRMRVEPLLRCILEGTGLDFVRLSSGTYVVITSARSAALLGGIAGAVRDAETGEPIENASIVLAPDDVGTASSRSGRFAFQSVTAGPHVLSVSHVAYEATADSVLVVPGERVILSLQMDKRTIQSDPLVIVSTSERNQFQREQGSVVRDVELLDLNPLGSVNVLETLDHLEGIDAGGSLSSVHLQGSDSGEHVYRLDGMQIFVPVRIGGLIGPFSPFAIGEIHVRKAGFGAEYGSQLAGVIDITQQITPKSDRRVDFLIDPLSVNGRVSGRTGGERRLKASWMIAARRDVQYPPYFDRLDHILDSWSAPDFFLVDELLDRAGLDPLGSSDRQTILARRKNYDVGFTDVHAASRLEINQVHSLQASFYHNRFLFGENVDIQEDLGMEFDSEDRYRWSNAAGQVRYEGTLSGRLFADAGAWFSTYRLDDMFGDSPLGLVSGGTCDSTCFPSEDFNEVSEIGLNAGMKYFLSLRHTLSAQIEAVRFESDFALTLQPDRAPVAANQLVNPVPWRLAAVGEHMWSPGRSARLITGVRLTFVPYQEAVYAEPRVSFETDLFSRAAGTLSLQAAAGFYRQFSNQVDVSTYNIDALFPSIRFWLPLDRAHRPPEAIHLVGGLAFATGRRWTFSVDGYLKDEPRLFVLNYGEAANQGSRSDPRGSDPIPALLATASANALGLAISARRQGRFVGFEIRYELGRADRSVPDRFGGRRLKTPWDAPHRLAATMEIHPSEAIVLSVRWESVYGRSWGFRSAYYDYLEPGPAEAVYGAIDLSDPESHVLPAFMQLDTGLTYTATIGSVDVQARVHLLNALNRENVRDWSLVRTAGGYERVVTPDLPFLPMFSIRLGL